MQPGASVGARPSNDAFTGGIFLRSRVHFAHQAGPDEEVAKALAGIALFGETLEQGR